MNVAMVAYSFYEGDNRVMRYAETLAARGDLVDVIALRQADETEFQAGINGVNVHRIQARAYDERGLRSYATRIAMFFLRASRELSRLHRRHKYDVIHVHSVPDPLVFTALVPKLNGAKIILDIHDLLPELYISKFSNGSDKWMHRSLVAVERACATFADHVIVANDLWREKIVARGSVKNERCTAILNFPDEKIFKKNGTASRGDKLTIMYPGTLNWHQGLDIAIKAFGIILNEVPETEFHIYGNGGAKESLVQLTQDLGLQDKVLFHKGLPLRSIAKTMATADIGVVPKRKDSFGDEAFSTKTLEFMSLGVPLILADTTIDKHYFNDSVVRFFHSGDHEDLAASLLDLIKNADLRQRLAENGLRFVQQHTWAAHQHEYLQLVDSLAQQ